MEKQEQEFNSWKDRNFFFSYLLILFLSFFFLPIFVLNIHQKAAFAFPMHCDEFIVVLEVGEAIWIKTGNWKSDGRVCGLNPGVGSSLVFSELLRDGL